MKIGVAILLFVGGWLLSRAKPVFARQLSCIQLYAALATILVLLVTGVMRNDGRWGEAHRWTGHSLLIGMWLSGPLIIAGILQREWRQRPLVAIGNAVVWGALILLIFSATVTGYLGPSYQLWDDPNVAEQLREATNNRFRVLHLYILPATIIVLMLWSRRMLQSRHQENETK